MLRIHPTWILLAFLFLPTFGNAEMHRFKSWYPRYSSIFTNLTEGNCSGEYKMYQTGNLKGAEAYKPLLGWDIDSPVMPLLNCLLDNTPEIYKFVMSSSQVLMGLIPTLFVNLGPDFHQLAMLLVYGDHHLLYIMLRLGAPSLLFDNTVGFRDQFSAILSCEDRLPREKLPGPNIYVMTTEYILASAAVANMFYLSMELTLKASFTIAQDASFLLPLWIVLALVVQFLGAIVLGIIARSDDSIWKSTRGFIGGFSPLEWIRRQRPKGKGYADLDKKPQDCSKTEVLFSWLTKVLSYVVLLYATLVLSSPLFISVKDSPFVVLRVLASATLCRIITEYEIYLLQQAPREPPEESKV